MYNESVSAIKNILGSTCDLTFPKYDLARHQSSLILGFSVHDISKEIFPFKKKFVKLVFLGA